MSENIKKTIQRKTIWETLLACLLAAMLVCGLFMALLPKNISITGPVKEHLAEAILALILFFIAFRILIKALFTGIDSSSGMIAEETPAITSSWIRTSLVIFVCWLPYLVICYPAVTRGYDYFWQILMGTGVFPLSNHHPVLSSLVIGLLYRTGAAIGGASFGLAFSMFVQTILLAMSAGFSLSYICSENRVNRKARLAMLLLICFSPVFPGHAMFLVKDTLFTALGTLFFTLCYMRINSIVKKQGVPMLASYPVLIALGVCFSLYRNGTKPVTLIMLAVLLFVEIRNREKGDKDRRYLLRWGAALIAFLIATSLWNQILSAKDVYPTDKREALAMPTRQIIRTVGLHPEAMTDETEKVLETAYQRKLSLGLSIPEIIEQYDDMNADYIKIDFVDDEDFLPRYIRLWISLGLRHPGSYADAFLRGTDGYWYPLKNPHLEAKGVVIHTICTTPSDEDFANEEMRQRQLKTLFYPTVLSLENAGIDTEQTFADLFPQYPWLEELMNVKPAFPAGRTVFGELLAKLENVPVLSMILAPGTYLWIMLICLAYMFSRRKNGLYLWPVLMIDGIAWLSPVNGYTRYVLLIELYSILMIGMCFSESKKEQNV